MENQKMTKMDIDIEWKEVLWSLVKGWRLIIVLAVICGTMLAAYQYRSDANATDVVVVKKTQEELETSMSTQDIDEVIGVVSLKRQLDQKSEYMDSSVLMQINPYEECATYMQYYVTSDMDEVAEDVAKAYEAAIQNGKFISEIAESVEWDIDTKYLAELISTVNEENRIYFNVEDTAESIQMKLVGNDAKQFIQVKVCGRSTEECEMIASALDKEVKEYAQEVNATVGVHDIVNVSLLNGTYVDQSLAELQNRNATAIKTISNNIDKMKNEMTGDQIALYTYRTVLEDSKETTAETATSVDKVVSVSVKHIIIGAVLGIILACVFNFCRYIMTETLRNGEELKTLYRVRILGYIDDSEFGKKRLFGFVDRFLSKIKNRKRKALSYEQEIRMISANIIVDCQKNNRKNLCITGSVIEKVPENVVNAIIEKCKNKGINISLENSIVYDAELLEKCANIDGILLIEKVGTSLYEEMYKEITICKENNIDVIGVAVLGV